MLTQASESASVTLYTHPDCPFSAAAKMDYRRRRIQYTEIDIAKEPDKITDLLALSDGERITPIIIEDDKVIIGFKGGY